MTVRLGATTFNGAADVDGHRFVLSDIAGWEFPDVDLSLESLHQDGAALAQLRLPSRSIVLSGIAHAQTPAGVWLVRRKLAAAAGLIRAPGTLYVDEASPGVPTQAQVYAAQPLRVRRAGPYGVEFAISLVALDPRKYSQTLTDTGAQAGALTVNNPGNYPTPPTIEFAGPLGPYWVLTNSTDGAKFIRFDVALATGTTLTVDFAAQTVTHSGGASWYQYMSTTSQWWELLVGNNSITFDRQANTGTWRAKYRAAYL